MDTETMIRELERVEENHKDDRVFTGQLKIKALEEIQQYWKIGTVEECMEAVEKQKPKKPRILSSRGGKGGKYCVCPRCNGVTGKYISYCRSCGQAIQWNENLEGMEDE